MRTLVVFTICARGAGVRAGRRRWGWTSTGQPRRTIPSRRRRSRWGGGSFEDRRLSRDGTLSCAVCHDPSRAFADGRVVASARRADQPDAATCRRSINRVYGASFFWDGRAASIEQQVVQPLLNPREMAMTPDAVVAMVRRDGRYRRQFAAAFGREPQLDDVARALASYVRTIRSGNSRYDRFRSGAASALTEQEQRGMRVFFGRGSVDPATPDRT